MNSVLKNHAYERPFFKFMKDNFTIVEVKLPFFMSKQILKDKTIQEKSYY